MILRSINVASRFPNPQLTNKVLACQLDILERASNMELYGLLDTAIDVNLDVVSNSSFSLDKSQF